MLNRLFFWLILLLLPGLVTAQRRDSAMLKTADGNIYGVLTTPAKRAAGPVPVVLIIPGSGGMDRDGNIGMITNDALRLLSDSLSRKGIASLRYDKRGTGRSKALTDESRLLFMHYVDDAQAWIRKLAKDKRFSRIYIAGYDEGSLVGMLAAKRQPVAGFVSLAGPGADAEEVVIEQIRSLSTAPQSVLDSTRMFFSSLRRDGRIEPSPSGYYQSIFRNTVQRYLVSWLQFDPAEELAALRIPVLIIHGGNDLQLDTSNAYKLARAKPDARLLIIPDMNHIFRAADAADKGMNIAMYYDRNIPIKKELVDAVTGFIRGKK